ncbi:MAG: tRNA dihydrouridine synthase DusB [Ignavibacteria bacterium]|nr:tRNA dihydrouridine synthase DusB [Ignavibacteria bacterium]
MLRIGNLQLANNLILAPMTEVTDSPFRALCRKFGSALTFTEMVSASGILKNDFTSLQNLAFSKEEHPIGVQFLGSDAETLRDAAQVVEEMGADLVDINAGCSVQHITGLGFGSSLLEDLTKLEKVVRLVKSGLRKIPLSIKIRLGKNLNKIIVLDAVKMLQNAGIDAITIHARTQNMLYEEPAIWEWIAKAKEIAQVPIIGNGDVHSPEHAKLMFERTSCDAVMIARGSLGKPWIFSQAQEFIEQNQINTTLSLLEIKEICLKHLDLLVKDRGEYFGVRLFRKHLMWYFRDYKFSTELKSKAFAIDSAEQLKEQVNEICNKYLEVPQNEIFTDDNIPRFKKRVLYWRVENSSQINKEGLKYSYEQRNYYQC